MTPREIVYRIYSILLDGSKSAADKRDGLLKFITQLVEKDHERKAS